MGMDKGNNTGSMGMGDNIPWVEGDIGWLLLDLEKK
jgi:hypothetical protein